MVASWLSWWNNELELLSLATCKELVLKAALACMAWEWLLWSNAGLELGQHICCLTWLCMVKDELGFLTWWLGLYHWLYSWESIREDKEVLVNVIWCFSFKKSHWLAIVIVGCVMSCLVKIPVMVTVISVKDAYYAHKKLRAYLKKLYMKIKFTC